MGSKRDGGAAFPAAPGLFTNGWRGLTARDYFAAKAMVGMLSSPPIVNREHVDKHKWAEVAYAFADAMIAERDKK